MYDENECEDFVKRCVELKRAIDEMNILESPRVWASVLSSYIVEFCYKEKYPKECLESVIDNMRDHFMRNPNEY